MSEQNNSKLIYRYAYSMFEDTYKSIDSLAAKLNSTLVFIGIVLVAACQEDCSGHRLAIKVCIITVCILTILTCTVGSYPTGSGSHAPTVDCMLEQFYRSPEEEVYVTLSRQISKSIEAAEKIRNAKVTSFKLASLSAFLSSILLGILAIS